MSKTAPSPPVPSPASSVPPPSAAASLLETIRTCVGTFAEEERHCARNARIHSRALEHQHHQTSEELDQRRIDQLQAVQEEHREACAFANHQAESRTKRLARAEQAVLFALPRHARAQREAWIGQQQQRHMQAGRDLNSQRAQLASRSDQQQEQLATLRTECDQLRTAARKAFRSFGTLKKQLQPPDPFSDETVGPPEPPSLYLRKASNALAAGWQALTTFECQPWAKCFRLVPFAVWLLIAIAIAAATMLLPLGIAPWLTASLTALLLVGSASLLHTLAATQCAPPGLKLAALIREAAEAVETGCALQQRWVQSEECRLQEAYEQECRAIQAELDRANEVVDAFEHSRRTEIERKVNRARQTIAHHHAQAKERADAARTAAEHLVETETATERARLEKLYADQKAALSNDESTAWTTLATRWRLEVPPLFAQLDALQKSTGNALEPWPDAADWQPRREHPTRIPIGTLQLNLDTAPSMRPEKPEFPLPGPSLLQAPLTLCLPGTASVCVETNGPIEVPATTVMQGILHRWLLAVPPGQLRLTLIEPVTLGRSFGGIMHLADIDARLINQRIWTQPDQIEQRLSDLAAHVEKIIQMYLRDEFDTIAEYNAHTGSIAEQTHLLVFTDFPAGLRDTALAFLKSILTSGPRCGVHTLIHRNTNIPLPETCNGLFDSAAFTRLRWRDTHWHLGSLPPDSLIQVHPTDAPPAPQAQAWIRRIGETAARGGPMAVPFHRIAPTENALWTVDTADEVHIPIGQTGAARPQHLTLGRETMQHALFAGKTGSGKSTLFHVIITNLALACSPDQVEFYLVDFKKGVEFKCYADHRLPHARVIAIESDRAFALSVLQRVDAELKKRGDRFRAAGVRDLAGFRTACPQEPMPRSLLLIDEFQEFFVEEDAIAQEAALLFDRIVRQGRAFGIHVLLGSQTLGGAYALARATLGQMAIRVALQCSETDAHLIMGEENAAPRLLSRPGEAIYNAAGGRPDANRPFQVVWLSEADRLQCLQTISRLAGERGYGGRHPVIFEGNTPADPSDNHLLTQAVQQIPTQPAEIPHFWLGAPNAIKDPTVALFERSNGRHLLCVGQNPPLLANTLAIGLLGLAGQYPGGTTPMIWIKGTHNEGAPPAWFQPIALHFPQPLRVIRPQEATEVLAECHAELQKRMQAEQSPAPPASWFVVIHGLHHLKKLRTEDQFAFDLGSDLATVDPATQLQELLAEGAAHGIHLIATIDSGTNVLRALSRKALAAFSMRLLLQMSANDSATLIDSPQAASLGLHRAIFYQETDGTVEIFRPYSEPTPAWCERILQTWKENAGVAAPVSFSGF